MTSRISWIFLVLALAWSPRAHAVQCPIPNCPPDQLCFCPPPPPHHLVVENPAGDVADGAGARAAERIRVNLGLTAMFQMQPKFAPKPEPVNKPEDQIPQWTVVTVEVPDAQKAELKIRVAQRSPIYGVKRAEIGSFTLTLAAEEIQRAQQIDEACNRIMSMILKRKFAAFGARLAYVERTGPGKGVIRMGRVNADFAGKNADAGSILGFSLSLNRSPVWSPDRKVILFTSSIRNNLDLYLVPADGSREPHRISAWPGMNHSPSFSPDGKTIALTMDHAGSPDIFLLAADYATTKKWRIIKQLTNHYDIDTSAAFSPDGKRIAFVSARNGRAQIFVMNADGSGQRLLLSTPHRTFTPRWCRSENREFIAFTQLVGNQSVIFIYDVVNQNGWQATPADAPDAENPTWSPHCNLVAYESHGDSRRPAGIYISPLVGGASARLLTGDARMPAWEPATLPDDAAPVAP